MEKLSPAEEEVMQAIWKTNGGFIRDFMEHMDDSIPYTTIASTVKPPYKPEVTGVALFILMR